MPMSTKRCSAAVASMRVDRRQDEVAGEGGLHCDARGLHVPDLTHEDHVGVLAQDRLQAAGERDAGQLR